ncbi:phosphotransferase family protein [Nonomuraea sp. NPDC050451]|uniref:phosphotransferase family protein n=1 Tax=Nonomuraea sp. NPDC050451 TaxID=3364364 RepID=UPI0037A3851F
MAALAGGKRVFVKAVPADGGDADAYREEAAVSAALPPGVPAPRPLTPAPVDGLPTVAARMKGRCELWQGPGAARLGAWERDHLARLAEVEREWESLVTGDTMLHFDPRFDNILIDERGPARLVDWGRACVGPDWVDLVCLLRTRRTCGSGASAHAAPPSPGSAAAGREGAAGRQERASRRRGCRAARRGRARSCAGSRVRPAPCRRGRG